jgi:methionyl-tRNA formyltransferase
MRDHAGLAAIHEIVKEIDAGPVVASQSFVYPPTCRTPKQYFEVEEANGLDLIRRWLPEVFAGRVKRDPQPHELSVYWPRLSTAIHGWIDWTWSARDVISFCDAFDEPHEGAKTYLRGSVVRLARVAEVETMRHHPFQFGLIVRIDAEGVCVAARGAVLLFRCVTLPPGGEPPRPGDRFVTPRWVLDRAINTRVHYSPGGAVSEEAAAPMIHDESADHWISRGHCSDDDRVR